MPLFFYGTLRDPDVQRLVTGSVFDPAATEPAVLTGYRAARVAGERYPVLVANRRGRTDGLLVHALPRAAIERIAQFESDEYRPVALSVIEQGWRRTQALVFVSNGRPRCSREAWDIEAWRRHDKAVYLRRTRRWITQVPTVAQWEAERWWRICRRYL